MMSIGLHCRVIGRPGRSRSLDRFIDYAKGFDGVWFATREEIARSWLGVHGGNAHSAARDLTAESEPPDIV
jgi:peptidoglycan/xylan/chitin deacetylase (PgdA/CDA1 family)